MGAGKKSAMESKMYSICFADLSRFLLDEIILRRLEAGGVDNFDSGDTERPGEPDLDDYVNQPADQYMVKISKQRLAELLNAHNVMDFYRDIKVDDWAWYGAALDVNPNADNLLDRLDINDIENMLEAEAEKRTLTPDWYPDAPSMDEGDTCRQPGCKGVMGIPKECTCNPTNAPCRVCDKGWECSACRARETDWVPAPVVPLPERLTFDPPAIKAPDVNGPPGAEEGETCRRDKCDGKMGYKTGKCGCNWPNANPPCSYCTEGPYCDSCDAKRDDDNQPTRDLPPKGKWWLVFDPKAGKTIGVNGYGKFFRERETAVFAAERYALDTREICFVVEADCMIVPPKQSCTVKKI